jgi:hypothetical protein
MPPRRDTGSSPGSAGTRARAQESTRAAHASGGPPPCRPVRQTVTVDVRQVLLDARVAEAAEAWLSDPQDVGVYARLVAAIEERRRHLHRTAEAVPTGVPGNGVGPAANLAADPKQVGGKGAQGDDGRPEDAQAGENADRTSPDRLAVDAESDVLDEPAARSWPAVRSVGADLVGDPAAVLRRLRGR